MTERSHRRIRAGVQQVFWFMVTCAAYLWLAVPATLCKLFFGSPA